MLYPDGTNLLFRFYNSQDKEFYGDIKEGIVCTSTVSLSPVRDIVVSRVLEDGRVHYTSIWNYEVIKRID